MNDEEKAQLQDALRRVGEMESMVRAGLFPVNDNMRVLNGIGFIGTTADTTPGGAIIVNSPSGPIKILTV